MKRKVMFSILVSICVSIALTGCSCEHNWSEATCIAPQTCTLCEKTEGKILPHNWQDATCTSPKTCKDCNLTEGETLAHTWVDATCEDAKTCSVCKLTEGDALGHIWIDATCESAKTCSVCNKSEGEALEHKVEKWEAITEAECTTEGTNVGICVYCGTTINNNVSSLGHQWVDATSEAPKTCSLCGATEGKPLIVYANQPQGLSVDETEWENWKSKNNCSLFPFMTAGEKVNYSFTIPWNSDKNHKNCEFIFTDNGGSRKLANSEFYYGLDKQDVVYVGLSTSNKATYANYDFKEACIRMMLSYNIRFDSENADSILNLSRARATEIVNFCFNNQIEHCTVDDMRIRLIRNDDYYSFHIEY